MDIHKIYFAEQLEVRKIFKLCKNLVAQLPDLAKLS